MALTPGSDFETGAAGAQETILLKPFLPDSLAILQSAFYGMDGDGNPIEAPVAEDGKSVTLTVLAGIQALSCAILSPSLATETVSLGQAGSVFATPTLIGGFAEGVVIIKGVAATAPPPPPEAPHVEASHVEAPAAPPAALQGSGKVQ